MSLWLRLVFQQPARKQVENVRPHGHAIGPVCGMAVGPESAAESFEYKGLAHNSCNTDYPVFGILLSPMIAEEATSFSSVSVIGNVLRLGRVRLYKLVYAS